MYVGIDIQKNVQSRNWYILHTYVRNQYKSKILYTVGIDIVQGNEMGHRNQMGLQHYTQDMSKIPIKYNINVLFTQSIHTLCLSVGGQMDGRTDGRTDARTDGRTDGRTDARTHGRTENIYSIFRDKLLLRGEHVFSVYPEKESLCFNIT